VALFIGRAFVPAVMAADGCVGCAPNCGSCHDEHFVDKDCTSCHTDTAEIHDWDISVVELEGREKNKAISEALKNDDVKLLRKTLIEKGYTPRVSDASVQKVTALGASGDVPETLFVAIPFAGEVDSAEISFSINGERTEASAGIIRVAEDGRAVIEVLTIDDEGMITTHILEYNQGVITLDGKIIGEIHTTPYELCMWVCNNIYLYGCYGWGLYLCRFTPFPSVCKTVWYKICVWGMRNSCYTICEDVQRAGG